MMEVHLCTHERCNQYFFSFSDLELHLETHNRKKPYVCLHSDCTKSYQRSDHLKRHEKLVHGEEDTCYRCETCNKTFKSINDIKLHNRIYKGNGFSCNKLPRSTIDPVDQVSENQTEEKIPESSSSQIQVLPIFVCSRTKCGQSFTSEDLLNKHLKSYHDARKYICTHCSKEFKKQQHLDIHSYCHTNVKPFKCDDCDKTFLFPSKLKAHKKFHKNYFCHEEDCNAQFQRFVDFRKHLKDCHPILFSCNDCGKEFASKRNYEEHLLIHKEQRVGYSCPHDDCQRVYYHKKNLNFHLKSFHQNMGYPCDHEGCTKVYRNKHNLVQHQMVHQPGYVRPVKKKHIANKSVMLELFNLDEKNSRSLLNMSTKASYLESGDLNNDFDDEINGANTSNDELKLGAVNNVDNAHKNIEAVN